MLNLLEGRSVPIYGRGNNVRDWLYVEDQCRALDLLLQRGHVGQVYNIGGDCERTNLQVVNMICDIVDTLRPELPFGPSRRAPDVRVRPSGARFSLCARCRQDSPRNGLDAARSV